MNSLALAYYFTDDVRYAEHAVLLLQTWFLNEDTRMNPHLEYGQAIPGMVDGRGIGIIDTSRFPILLQSVELLKGSAAWTVADHGALQAWIRAYLAWLLTSSHGQEEASKRNNHGTWFDAQVASYGLFVGDQDTASRVLKAVGETRLLPQIDTDGKMPLELARTKSFDYSCFNLTACFQLATMAEQLGLDLWRYPNGSRPAIQVALDYLLPFANAGSAWPHQQIVELNRSRLLPLLRQGYVVYADDRYIAAIESFTEDQRTRDLSLLHFPVSGFQSEPSAGAVEAGGIQ